MLGDKPQTTLWWKYVQHNPRKPPAKQYEKGLISGNIRDFSNERFLQVFWTWNAQK